jgi:mono/diheme cytochrome c family protein
MTMVRLDNADWLCSALMLAATFGSTAALAADPNNGERLAQQWCIPCHVVASNQIVPTSEAPPFATIAGRHDFDAARLAFFLLEPHPKMPSMSLSRLEAADLAAYIATLK